MTESRDPITLIGEEIDGQWNEDALADIASAFGGTYIAYNGWDDTSLDGDPLPVLSRFDCLMAAENLAGAQSVYSFRSPNEGRHALIIGNEAKGLRRRTRKQAHVVVEIPLASKNINCLNAAVAAAVLLYYLTQGQPLNTKQRSLTSIQQSRPGLLLVGGSSSMDLGSTIRSACAFGWDRVFLDDPGDAWYECDRRIKSEGRGAARRGRNPIMVIPYREDQLAAYRKIILFTTRPCGLPLYQLPLTGKDLLLAMQDESAVSIPWSPPATWAGEVIHASLPAVPPSLYHYRQMSTIALAEAARQMGQPASGGIYLRSKKDRYRREMEREETATLLDLEALSIF